MSDQTIQDLKELLIAQNTKEEETPQNTLSNVSEVFSYISGQSKDIIPQQLTNISSFYLSQNNNLVINQRYEDNIYVYSMQIQKKVLECEKTFTIRKIGSIQLGNSFLIAGGDQLVLRDQNSFQLQGQVQLPSNFFDFICGEEQIYVSLNNGDLYEYSASDLNHSVQIINAQEFSRRRVKIRKQLPLQDMQLSNDKIYLVGYMNLEGKNDVFQVWNVQKKQHVFSGVLEIEDSENAKKMIRIAANSLTVTVRYMLKGVKVFSLTTGSILFEKKGMHTNYINQILFTEDDQLLFTCGKDKKIKVWNWISYDLSQTLLGHEDSVTSLVASKSKEFLFSASLDSSVVMWCLKNYCKLCSLKCNSPIVDIQMNDDQQYLLAQAKNMELYYWTLEENKDSFRLNFGLSGLAECYVTPNDEFLLITNEQKEVEIWNIKSRTRISQFKSSSRDRNIRSINGTHDSKYIFYQREQGEITQWDTNSFKEVGMFQHQEDVIDIVVTKDDKFMFSIAGNFLYKWDIETRQIIYQSDKYHSRFSSMCLTHNDMYLCIQMTGPKELVKFNTTTQEMREIDPVGTSYISQFELSFDNKYLVITGYGNGILYIVDFETDTLFKKTNNHKTQADYLGFTSDQKFLITRSKTETIIWDCQYWTQFAFIEEKCAIITSSHRICNALIHDGLYKPWNVNILKDFSDDYQIDENSQDQELRINGPLNKITPLIFKEMLDQVKSLRYKFINILRQQQIMPFKYNLVHFFSYTNNPDSLSQALIIGVFYTRDKTGKSPLEHSIERNSYECSSILLEYIISKENIYGMLKERELNQLITFSPSNLFEFFENSIKVQEENVPNFGKIRDDKELLFLKTDNYLLDEISAKQLLDLDKQAETQQQPLEYKTLKFQYNFATGSYSSMQFHQSLGEANQDTFRSEAIQQILTFKWDEVKGNVYKQAFIYLLYLTFITTYIILSIDAWYMDVIFYLFATFQTALEVGQICLNKQAYFQDKFNYFDLMRVILIWVHCINNSGLYSSEILSLLNLLSWVRGLAFLRLFKSARVLIRLIMEVAGDMIAFMVVLFIALFAFSLSFEAINRDNLASDYTETLAHNYRLMYGDFDVENYNIALWILFIIASIFMPLVMLNLLIAIMSDTYDRVMQDILPIDFQELNSLILEQECLMFMSREFGKPQNLNWVSYTGASGMQNKWQGKIVAALQRQNKQTGLTTVNDEIAALKEVAEQLMTNQKIMQKEQGQRYEDQKKKSEEMFLLIKSLAENSNQQKQV